MRHFVFFFLSCRLHYFAFSFFLPAIKFALFCLARFVSGFFSIGVNSENFLLVRAILNCMEPLL